MFQYDEEVTIDQIQAFNHRIGFVETCFWKDQHHESVQQFLVFYQFHIALSHL